MMPGIIVVCQYIRLLNREGEFTPNHSYQNLFIGHTRNFQGVDHRYAPYKITGGGSVRGGDNIQATLNTIPNKLTIPFTSELVLQKKLLQITQVFVNVDPPADPIIGPTVSDFYDIRVINTQIWKCSSCYRDNERVSLGLKSPLDAIEDNAPNRVYSSRLIGNAPATSFISSS